MQGLVTFALLLSLGGLQDAPPAGGGKPNEAYRPGHVIRSGIRMTDVFGKEHELLPRKPESELMFEVAGDRTTVIVFWSLRDPISRRYVETLAELGERFADDGLVIYLVDSNHDEITGSLGDPLDKIRRFLEETKTRLPVLVDRGNVVADAFGAISANHAFLIGRDRAVAYTGAIDDDPRGQREESGTEIHHYLRDAIEASLAGEPVEQVKTRPQGRPIKRAPAPAEAETGR